MFLSVLNHSLFVPVQAGMSSLTIYSGGAKGVDSAVEYFSAQRGHTCVVYLPPCHPRAKTITPLTPTQLKDATPIVFATAFRLQRTLSNPMTEQYLCRNWHIVKDATLLLAFGFLDSMERHVQGGTGWTVDMAKAKNIPVYVFDLNADLWYLWIAEENRFQSQDEMSERWIQPPTLQDKTAIVGTREPHTGYLVELRRLFSISSD